MRTHTSAHKHTTTTIMLLGLRSPKHDNITSTTIHATTKSFVLFCSAQDGENQHADCFVFLAHCKNFDRTLSINSKGILLNMGNFKQHEILECSVDSE